MYVYMCVCVCVSLCVCLSHVNEPPPPPPHLIITPSYFSAAERGLQPFSCLLHAYIYMYI